MPLDIEVFKEPRGFIRCLELFFAIVAFSTLANFSTEFSFNIKCKNETGVPLDDSFGLNILYVPVGYPFNIAGAEPKDLSQRKPCGVHFEDNTQKYSKISFMEEFNFSSDAQFYVFVGVISFLYAVLSVLVYGYYADKYLDDPKNFPKMDFMVSAVLAMFWLAGSAAWANGLSGLKFACNPDNWLYRSDYGGVCAKASNNVLKFSKIDSCNTLSAGSFAGANGAVLLGFINFVLWTANLWYLYKETSWFAGKKQTVNLEVEAAGIEENPMEADQELEEQVK